MFTFILESRFNFLPRNEKKGKAAHFGGLLITGMTQSEQEKGSFNKRCLSMWRAPGGRTPEMWEKQLHKQLEFSPLKPEGASHLGKPVTVSPSCEKARLTLG